MKSAGAPCAGAGSVLEIRGTSALPARKIHGNISQENGVENNKVVILRGPPGAGKSHYARNKYHGAFVVSADDVFMVLNSETGREEYRFDPAKLGMAHAECFHKFLVAMDKGEPLIVIDNTNIHHWEYANYLKAAKMLSYIVDIVEFGPETLNEVRACIRRNVHRVPAEIILRMCHDFESCYKEKNVTRLPILEN